MLNLAKVADHVRQPSISDKWDVVNKHFDFLVLQIEQL